ncbi:alpha/beta fold hydrolase [Algoriphagus sp. A40]|uniref:alpha/beta fold hydrolase n=1 Tax=Algoriphagus sp. A40 TaxID=1945863 RepID=UPI00143BB5B0|nr:alpha/beta hydrolase [Algoriphagus sp. A40]
MVTATIPIIGCQQEEIPFSKNENETFYVEHLDSKLRVQMRGNTLSDKIVLTVHGGPGGSSYYLSYLDEMKELEQDYAIAYWDQPMAGSSQGNNVGFKVDDIAEGLRKIIVTLKNRYGNSKKVILYSESWGGIISTAFLTKGNNQLLVNGWINSDGPHDFNLMDREIVKMAIHVGSEEIAKGNNVETWSPIIEYCEQHNPCCNTYEESQKLNELLGDAEYLIDTVVQVEFNTIDIFWSEMLDNNAPFTASGFNLFSNNINGVEKDAWSKDYTKAVAGIKVPLLLLWGKYDFIVPPAVADSLLSNVQSAKKQLVLLERSGHNGFLQEPQLYWPAMKEFLNEL